jgi:hypothetical protein
MEDFFSNMGSSMALIMSVSVLPFVLIGLGLLVWALRGRSKAKGAQNWPFVAGTVVHSGVDVRRSSNGRGSTTTSYYPVVAYEYEVQGHRYRSDKLNFGQVGYGSARTAEAKAAPYLPGNRVNVYYDPADPGVAVLERTSPQSSVLIWVVLLILVIVIFTAAVTFGAFGMFGNMFSGVLGGLGDVLTQVPKQ